MSLSIMLAERGLIPDAMIRSGIRKLLATREAEETARANAYHDTFVASLAEAPVALDTQAANEQHYEVPAAFFEQVLGPHLKYSCCHYTNESDSLADAEAAMLKLTCERAGLQDGMRILELGCGWGSLTRWMARQYPETQIHAVSNSATQRKYIEARCAEEGLGRVTVETCDMNHFNTEKHYDRVVSVEMFEHMRNYPQLFRRICQWLNPDGKLFLHIFCHKTYTYPFEVEGDDNWMGRYFFTGGMMPAYDLPGSFKEDLHVAERWQVNGIHYYKTCQDWLENMDAHKEALMPIFSTAYGEQDAKIWFQRWRIFFMSCAELFRYQQGNTWFVGHYLMQPEK